MVFPGIIHILGTAYPIIRLGDPMAALRVSDAVSDFLSDVCLTFVRHAYIPIRSMTLYQVEGMGLYRTCKKKTNG